MTWLRRNIRKQVHEAEEGLAISFGITMSSPHVHTYMYTHTATLEREKC